MKIIFYSILTFLIIVFTSQPVKAVLPPLTDNQTGYYCDTNDGTYYFRHDCTIAPEKVQFCTINNCSPTDIVWQCAYNPAGRCNPSTGAVSGPEAVIGFIQAPHQISVLGTGSKGISTFLATLINIFYVLAGLIFFFMIIIGAFQWITSGGDKEALNKARGRITHAIIGITLLAFSLFIVRLIGNILGFNII